MRERFDDITNRTIGAAIEVHRELGPGLLESAHDCRLCFELARRGLTFERQKIVPLTCKGVSMGTGYRMDLWWKRR